ncbi:MAG: helix-turn-helix domain-containing protein [Pirellulales bacterium]
MNDTTTNKMLLTAREAAELLGVSEKTLWNHSYPRGTVPIVRFGKTLRYSPDALQRWILEQEKNCHGGAGG